MIRGEPYTTWITSMGRATSMRATFSTKPSRGVSTMHEACKKLLQVLKHRLTGKSCKAPVLWWIALVIHDEKSCSLRCNICRLRNRQHRSPIK